MCVGARQQEPRVVVAGPTPKEIKTERKQEKQELKQIRRDSRAQAQEFQQQLQNQIDAADTQAQLLQQQIAEVLAPPAHTVLANNYAVTTQQQALPANAQTTEVMAPVRPQPTSLRIMPGATSVAPGAGLNIGA